MSHVLRNYNRNMLTLLGTGPIALGFSVLRTPCKIKLLNCHQCLKMQPVALGNRCVGSVAWQGARSPE